MARTADFGLILWDGKSKGSGSNLKELTGQDKKTLVYLSPLHPQN